jgi:hypothetical protein
VGLRFDPILPLPDWRERYRELFCELAAFSGTVEDVEVGVFRYTSSQREALLSDEAGRQLLDGEFVHCEDGKVRLCAPLRIPMFREIVSMIRAELGGETRLRICMEPPWVSRSILPFQAV